MAKGFNKVILMGNLTRDPENRTTSGGQNVTNFSLAVNRSWKSADGTQQEQVSFINCVAWGKTGEIISQYVSKGNPLLVSGRLDQRSWDDKDSGQKRSTVEVVVEDFNFIGSGRNSDGADNGNKQSDNSGSSNNSDNNAKNDDVVIQDIDDKPIDLSEIPF
jgi:single-strand DNA-binding protein